MVVPLLIRTRIHLIVKLGLRFWLMDLWNFKWDQVPEIRFVLIPISFYLTVFYRTIPEGKCEIYQGKACASLLAGKSIYVDPFLTQSEMEEEIHQALNYISKFSVFDGIFFESELFFY